MEDVGCASTGDRPADAGGGRANRRGPGRPPQPRATLNPAPLKSMERASGWLAARTRHALALARTTDNGADQLRPAAAEPA
jgi:hypothetical protein